MKVIWQGVYPAVTTKFDSSDKLDLKMFSKNIEAQLAAGVNGIVLGGTLGEASTLSSAEKVELVKTCKKLCKNKVPVIINIAESSTKNAVDYVSLMSKAGADGFMLLPPMRYSADDRETLVYFERIANSTDLPIMIYNNPVDYKINVTLDMFEQLTKFKNIQAVKESTRDVRSVTTMINRFGDRFKILSGVDNLALESLMMGADGWVAGLVCAFPKETVAIYKLAKAGKYQEALAIYRWFIPLLELDVSTKLVQNIKLAETLVGLGTEFVREPRLTLAGDEKKRVTAIIKSALKVRPKL